jgi:phenylacetic acid degradation operon negative regulatory protein
VRAPAPPPVLPPLTARSVLLSVLLGSHPPELPVRTLVRAAELFGVTDGTARVALSRLVSEGDAVADGGVYRLSPRLAQRQRDQDRSVWPETRPWRGRWELAVPAAEVASAAERSTVGAELARLGLGELRPGVWGRPDNLVREWPGPIAGRVIRFVGRPDRPAPELVARLWDLPGWATEAEALIEAMAERDAPSDRLVVAAAMVRHIRTDPVLPPSLGPRGWPAGRLRRSYTRYRHELAALLSDQLGDGADDRARHKAV